MGVAGGLPRRLAELAERPVARADAGHDRAELAVDALALDEGHREHLVSGDSVRPGQLQPRDREVVFREVGDQVGEVRAGELIGVLVHDVAQALERRDRVTQAPALLGEELAVDDLAREAEPRDEKVRGLHRLLLVGEARGLDVHEGGGVGQPLEIVELGGREQRGLAESHDDAGAERLGGNTLLAVGHQEREPATGLADLDDLLEQCLLAGRGRPREGLIPGGVARRDQHGAERRGDRLGRALHRGERGDEQEVGAARLGHGAVRAGIEVVGALDEAVLGEGRRAEVRRGRREQEDRGRECRRGCGSHRSRVSVERARGLGVVCRARWETVAEALVKGPRGYTPGPSRSRRRRRRQRPPSGGSPSLTHERCSMIVGVPAEVKKDESRIGMQPVGAELLRRDGHTVLVQKGAGLGAGFTDEDYAKAGATIVDTAADVWGRADLIVKVKEPQPQEIKMMRAGQQVFTYYHFAADREMTLGASTRASPRSCTRPRQPGPGGRDAAAADPDERGRRQDVGAGGREVLEPAAGRRGILLGGVPGVEPAKVVVLGGGIVGTSAAHGRRPARNVWLLDVNLDRLRYLDEVLPKNITTVFSEPHAIRRLVQRGPGDRRRLIPAAKAPTSSARPTSGHARGFGHRRCGDRPGRVLRDQPPDDPLGPDLHDRRRDPLLRREHAGRSPHQHAALTNATLPWVLKIANQGTHAIAKRDHGFAQAIGVDKGKLLSKPVAERTAGVHGAFFLREKARGTRHKAHGRSDLRLNRHA